MANEFKIKNGFLSTGDSQVTGSLTVSNGITGSLFGTASWAENATSSSITVGTTPIINGTDGRVFFQSGSTVQQDAGFTWDNTNKRLILGTTGVNGELQINRSTGVTNIGGVRANSAGSGAEIGGGNNYTNKILLHNAQGIHFFTGTNTIDSSEKMRITSDTSWGVVIGTTTASSRLHVRGSGATSATTALRVENTNASASMVVLDNGFVGINTGSAQYALDVNGHVRLNTGFQLYFNNSNVGAYRDSNDLVLGGFGNIIFKSSNTNISSQTERARITSTGLFGIGTSSPLASLHVVGTALISGSQTITGSLIVTEGITGSLFGTAATASFTPNALVTASVSSNTITFTKGDGTTFPITVDTGSGGPGGSTFPYTGSAIISGSLEVTGSFSVNNGTALKIDTATSTLTDDSNYNSVDWQNRILEDTSGNTSVDWANRTTSDSSGNTSIDWENRALYDSVNVGSIDFSGLSGLNIIKYRPTTERLELSIQEDFTQNTLGLQIASNIAGTILEIETNIDLTVTASNTVFLDTDGIWKQADQTTDTTTKLLGICLNGYNKGAILTEGTLTVTTSSGYTDIPFVSGSSFYGMPVYLTGSTSTLTTDKPTSGYVRVVGYMYYNSTTTPDYWIMKFNPSNDWYEI